MLPFSCLNKPSKTSTMSSGKRPGAPPGWTTPASSRKRPTKLRSMARSTPSSSTSHTAGKNGPRPKADRPHRRAAIPLADREARLRYLKEVRPKSSCRELFLAMRAPFRPLTSGTLWPVVARRLRPLGLSIKHHGPHSLRHACATRLINEGLSLKEVGDHLGHRSPETTRIYAKVDLVRLREVASFDLGGLL